MNEDQVYKDTVNRLMAAGSSELIQNGQHRHAAILMESFFNHAVASVKIFCLNLDKTVFDQPEVIEAAEKALKAKVAIEIIVQDQIQEGSQFADKVNGEWKKECYAIKMVNNAKSINKEIFSLKENFAVMDDKAIRYEEDSREPKAIACMNHPQYAASLNRAFQVLKNSLQIAA